MLTRERARELTEKVLGMTRADEASVGISGGELTHLRFARNSPSTSGSWTNSSLSLGCTFGTRTGSVSVNQFDDTTLREAIARCEEIARLAPEDPEFVPVLGPQGYEEVDAYSSTTAERGPEYMATGVARCIADASARDLVAAGFTQIRAGYSVTATSRGLFGYHPSTAAFVAETVRTRDATGSGWASQASHRAGDIDYSRVSATAVEKALASAKPRALPPGRYVTILEPVCVANLVQRMVGRMSARAADEGRSYFSAPGGGNRLGEQIFPEEVSIWSDPTSPEAPGSPWGSGGLPQHRRNWIERGRVASMVTGRYWAEHQGTSPVPAPSNLLMRGGEGGVDDLIRQTPRGVLVTSFWYIRDVDPRTLLLTGLTRDGVFWIENGEIVRPVTNFRWNDSPISVLKNVEAMSAPVRISPRPGRSTTVVVPAIRTSAFTLSSVSDAI